MQLDLPQSILYSIIKGMRMSETNYAMGNLLERKQSREWREREFGKFVRDDFCH